MLGGEGAEEHLGSLGELQDGASQHSEENYIFNINQALRNRKRENGGISNDCFSIDPWTILDHPHTMRQVRKDTDDDKHCSGGDRNGQCKDKEDSELYVNTGKMSHARGANWALMGCPTRHGIVRTRGCVAATTGRLLQLTDSELSIIWYKGWKECGLGHF